jgi:hypothetical protein
METDMTITCKTTKINKGVYELNLSNGESFQVAQYPDGMWITFGWCEKLGRREYMQHYWTKRDAIQDILNEFNS